MSQADEKIAELKEKAKTVAEPIVEEVKTVETKQTNKNMIMTTTGEIELSPTIVRKYLVNGQGAVTDQEVAFFIAMCKANMLNPFNKDAYLIKFGTQPASIITSKDVFFKRAIENPMYNGMKSGLWIKSEEGRLEKRESSIYMDGETIIGAWCTVYRKDWENPLTQDVNFNEYAGRTKEGKLNSNWATKPAVMIMKVAEATALRKAFTTSLQGMYIEEELSQQDDLKKSVTYTKEVTEIADALGD